MFFGMNLNVKMPQRKSQTQRQVNDILITGESYTDANTSVLFMGPARPMLCSSQASGSPFWIS